MRDYNELTSCWNDLLERMIYENELDAELAQRLIFETYHFEKNNIPGDHIPRNRLLLYKYVVRFGDLFYRGYPKGMRGSTADTFCIFAEGLSYAIENNFDCGYGANPLPISLNMHVPAGCAPLEADMTTYGSFIRDFNENVGWLREQYYEDEDEDEDVEQL
ncbi:MAG: hypothetical protein IJG50_08655 [Clostridia bacterium]|nr:hypothetical protein [Clostridia bacterium]